jgi:hypothetical protein
MQQKLNNKVLLELVLFKELDICFQVNCYLAQTYIPYHSIATC